MSDMVGKKLRWGGKQRLQSKAELFPHVIDRHGLACRTLTSRGTAFSLDNYVNCMGHICTEYGPVQAALGYGKDACMFKF